jgi:hypothetical protein
MASRSARTATTSNFIGARMTADLMRLIGGKRIGGKRVIENRK